ncbi:putative ABC transporter ATP-binding protein [Caballeronia glathei]|nr:putative ABC transporter ATP-binding protein [Caballeronia glathei]
MDGHDEPDRAAGGLRSRARSHPRRAAGRRHLQGVRHENLHHLRRTRHGGEHRPSRAGAYPQRARRREGHFAFPRAEVHGERRRHAQRAQRRALRIDRTQARHQGEPDRRAAVRRPRRRDRLSDRRGEPRARIHVHHDERGALRRRRAGHRGGGARVSTGRRVCEGARAEPPRRRLGEAVGHDHPSPGRAPHARDDARADRRRPRARLRGRRALGHRAPRHRRRHARTAHRDLRIPRAGREGLEHGAVDRCREPRRAGAWRDGLHRGDGRCAALPRRAHSDDLRGHDRDSGERPGRAQDGARRRRGRAGAARTDRSDDCGADTP